MILILLISLETIRDWFFRDLNTSASIIEDTSNIDPKNLPNNSNLEAKFDRINFTINIAISKLKTYRRVTIAFSIAYIVANVITIDTLLDKSVILIFF